jgi:hypothetical protein
VFSDGRPTEFRREKEVAERSVPDSQEHDLWLLGFLEEDGEPTKAGQALLEVLRSNGTLARSERDSGLHELCGILSRMTGIEASPFRFEHNRKAWIAEFGASSERAAR